MSDLSAGKDSMLRAASLSALQAPSETKPWDGHSVDFGVSLFGFYFRLIAGCERRSPERRANERGVKPLSTIGNVLFAGSISAVALSVLIVLVLVYSAVLSE
jgi:hypothetical protein